MKRPIYLDDRERDLARRVFAVVVKELNYSPTNDMARMAIQWTHDEVKALGDKFAEPEPPS